MEHGEQDAFKKSLRVADQSCSAHAMLRDKYKFRCTVTDLFCVAASIWLVAMVFIQPEIAFQIYPKGIPANIWTGILSIAVCIITVLHMLVDWKGKSQAHHHAVIAMSNYVKEFRPYKDTADDSLIKQALVQYKFISESIEHIPENVFLNLKQKHLVKVAISKHLDTNPGANIRLFRAKLWLRDNCGFFKKDNTFSRSHEKDK